MPDVDDLCECGGGGWFLCQDAGHADPDINGQAEVQRCDSCQRYEDDDQALRAFMEYVNDLETWVFNQNANIVREFKFRRKEVES